MAKKEKCEDCLYWKEWTFKTKIYLERFPTNRDKGDCRIKAPIVVGTSEEGYASWPDTNSFEWCGEFDEKVED